MTDNKNNDNKNNNNNTSNQGLSQKELKEKAEKQAKRDKALEEKFAKESENYERTSNQILEAIREKRISAYSPNPLSAMKQAPEQIADIHIVISQQKPEFAKEGKDTSDKDKEKKEKEEEKDES